MSFLIAMVQFTDGRRAYPVNCCRSYPIAPGRGKEVELGDYVIVFLDKNEPELKAAKVIELKAIKSYCKHTVVCFENQLDEHLRKGPPSVNSLHSMVKYLTEKDWHTLYETTSDEWYLGIVGGPDEEFGLNVFLVGKQGVAEALVGISRYRRIVRDDRLDVDQCRRISLLSPDSLRSFQRAAELANVNGVLERAWSEEDTLAQIRNAVSPDGGPAYLGDDVWI